MILSETGVYYPTRRPEVCLMERATPMDDAVAKKIIEIVRRVVRKHFRGISDEKLEEIIQETIVGVLRALPTLKDPEALPGLVRTIAIRTAIRLLRPWWRRWSVIFLDDEEIERLYPPTLEGEDEDDDFDAEEARRRLDELLEGQDPKKVEVWKGHRLRGHTIKRLAQETGKGEATVKRWIKDIDDHLKRKR
jgi:RNA polymerase sigma factor (sigma-70 family)